MDQAPAYIVSTVTFTTSRAIRGHFMADAVLNTLILARYYNVPITALAMENEE